MAGSRQHRRCRRQQAHPEREGQHGEHGGADFAGADVPDRGRYGCGGSDGLCKAQCSE